MVKYDPSFSKKARGKISAELMLDKSDKPIFVPTGSTKHYKIKLKFETDDPKVERVIYRLDQSYYDPIREGIEPEKDFEVETTTYGDYDFVVDVQVGNELVRQEVSLSDLLKEQYRKTRDKGILKAIKEIEKH